MSEPTFNGLLSPWQPPVPSADAGKGRILAPGAEANLRWQTRLATPTAYETDLADAIVQAYAQGGRTPAELASSLNAQNCLNPSGLRWTPETMAAEMRRLGH